MNLGHDPEKNNRSCFEDKHINTIFGSFVFGNYSRIFDLLNECKFKAIMRISHPLAPKVLKRIKEIEKEIRGLLVTKKILKNIHDQVNQETMSIALNDTDIQRVTIKYAEKIKGVFNRLQRRQQHDVT